MRFASIVAAFRRLTGRKRGPDGLHPVEYTRKLLAAARAAADRTGQCLSVVVFAARERHLADATWHVLAPALRTRLRITDEAGWFDAHRVCVILPFTPAAGAWKVADDLTLLFPETVPPPACEVFTYPTGNLPMVPGTPENNGYGNDHHATPGRNGRHHGHRNGHHPARPAAPLEPLFHRPISRVKRTVDVTGAAASLALLLPLLPLVALAIKLTSRGPVFFRQKRAGWGGRTFEMWKFRTMVADAEARKASLLALSEQDGPAFKMKRDPRVTRVGRFLRKTSIDELPQLWNVLVGDMSLVGPRPLPVGEAARCEAWQRRRLDVTPGLTCVWQVKGRSAVVSFAEWVRMDVQYIENHSIGEDLRLIFLTVPAMVLRKGGH